MLKCTLPETNIEPENGWLEYKFPFGITYFQGFISGRVNCSFIYAKGSNLSHFKFDFICRDVLSK